ncbi:hypothetical protein JCM19233_6215 [Vibrio astriarenae]|nr:hypothetical protein JCM19233_6215 [Vibrio sp. C7]
MARQDKLHRITAKRASEWSSPNKLHRTTSKWFPVLLAIAAVVGG